MEEKIKLLAKFFSNERKEDDIDYDFLKVYDVLWLESYKENIKNIKTYYFANNIANELIINIILKEVK